MRANLRRSTVHESEFWGSSGYILAIETLNNICIDEGKPFLSEKAEATLKTRKP